MPLIGSFWAFFGLEFLKLFLGFWVFFTLFWVLFGDFLQRVHEIVLREQRFEDFVEIFPLSLNIHCFVYRSYFLLLNTS